MENNYNITNTTTVRSLSEGGDYLSSKTVVAVVILIFYTIATPIFQKLNFHYLHESGICMLMGLIFGLVGNLISNTQSIVSSLQFNDEIFFNLVLPPIIFSAGYNLKKKSFFKFFFYIATFGIFGTLVSFGSVSSLTYLANKMSLFSPFNLSLQQILLFASVIASTDTVAALCFISDESQPKLFSILFGEGVLNDAVCIVLYRIIKNLSFEEKGGIAGQDILNMVYSFLVLFAMSTILGIFGGVFCSYILKKLKPFRLNRTQETSLIIFFAFLTYSLTELLGYSPIIALLFCGIFMSHYAFYNLSFQAREESSIVSKIMSNIAEGFIFTYLGLTSVTISHKEFSFAFIALVFIFCCVGRFFAVCGISIILTIIRCPIFTFNRNEQGIMFFAGCIRGAIAFGLAISIPEMGDPKIKQLMVSSTLVLVFFSTIVFGALMSSIVKFFTVGSIRQHQQEQFSQLQEMEKFSVTGIEAEGGPINEKLNGSREVENRHSGIKGLWHRLDDKYLRPFFIDDWPDVKTEHNQIAKEIIQVFEEYQKNKMKKKILSKFDPMGVPMDTKESFSTGYTMSKNDSLLFKE